MAEMDELRDLFFVECDELLDSLAAGLRQMETPCHDKETVHAVFRAVHSVKGGAAAFGLSVLVTFAHRFETVLDLIRSDRAAADQQVMPVMHRCADCLADLIAAARQDSPADQPRVDALLAELDRLIGGGGSDDAVAFTPILLDFAMPEGDESGFTIRFTPHAALYRSGNDPLALLVALQKLGDMTVTLQQDALPSLEDWTAAEPALQWHITLRTAADLSEVRAVFEFVVDCCDLEIAPIVQDDDAFTPIVIDFDAVPDPVPSNAPAAAPSPTAEATASIRVNLDRVDRLMNMIGELVIKEAMLSRIIQTAGLAQDLDVTAGLDAIRQLAGEIQESVMAIRAQPLKLVFQRMHRILREAADATGKPVQLITTGEQTEVDKTMIERLMDPLTHMIRNSVDHGLEDEVTRQRRGKPLQGTITLSAAHRSGRVQIEVSDDGGGIDRPRVRQIAEDRGLILPGTQLTPSEIDQLLFLPGFSSKAEVSAISGRGVGLDVVRREIMALGGRVMITSVEGKGTTFAITLPLTLAVLEGMLVQLGDQTMVLPITSVQETLRPAVSELHRLGDSGRMISNRGDMIPIIDLGRAFAMRDTPTPLEDGVLIVVETDSQKRAALHVDGIVDQRQVVIKSIEENYGRVAGVSAATILGDGQIALIIDPEEIVLASGSDRTRSLAASA
ncbi:two-component system, chemotaxis family, sensor kinase CheA [Ketogulonicigenium robustum]|uniref:Chemotaxis protein CheA n=1 Tax=Ketogulonicigenium robustum TaxID=92947 RepID=A0A1W6P066_9RHOB|nr:chemotaxis protein CheA [Ketogulonicigenium robustum]ARO14844.1 two-component system, chemotaxis family, sensor kinase CheA [Ketogulonicigenium robustum]